MIIKFVILMLGSDNVKKYIIIISVFIVICLFSIFAIFNHKEVNYFETILDDEYYDSLLAIEDESRNKDCIHIEVAKIPVLTYADLLYKKGRIDEEEKNFMLKSYGLMDEHMGTSIDNLMHIIFKCMEE